MSGSSLQSSQKLSQTTAITPRLQRALKLLQVPSTELRNELAVEMAANPVLEEIDSGSSYEESYDGDFRPEETAERGSGELTVSDSDFSALERMRDDWRDNYYDEQRSQSYTAEDAERRDHFFENHAEVSSLQERLLEQARDVADSPAVLDALSALVGNLDERGFLAEDPRDLALAGRLDASAMERAVALLRKFDPPGIGATDLRDCLKLQLERSGRGNSVAARILDEEYDDLLKRKFPEISRRLRIEADDLREALLEIAKLDTAPARRFAVDENRVITPDVLVTRDEETGELRAELTGDGVPRLRLSHPYKELLAGGRLSAKDRTYLVDKMKDGRFLIDALTHRQDTVLGVASRLLVHQADFFEKGRGAMRPLIMATVAADLGVHETTISRAVSGKWMRTPVGMIEMRDFFTSGYSTADGGSLAASGVKEMLASVIESEDAEDPLSDEGIVTELERRGVKLARRTVAKYREELGIAPRYLRRRQP